MSDFVSVLLIICFSALSIFLCADIVKSLINFGKKKKDQKSNITEVSAVECEIESKEDEHSK